MSGNVINGLDETQPAPPARRLLGPRPRQRSRMGAMQALVLRRHSPPIRALMRCAHGATDDLRHAPARRAGHGRHAATRANWTAALALFVAVRACAKRPRGRDAGRLGLRRRNRRADAHRHAGVQHAPEAIAKAPGIPAAVEVLRQYGRPALAAKTVTGWLRQQVWAAEPVTGPMTGPGLGDDPSGTWPAGSASWASTARSSTGTWCASSALPRC